METMASRLILLFLMASLLLLALDAQPSPAGDLIDKACAGWTTPPLCAQILRSDPRSAVTDSLQGLASLALDLAVAASRNATDAITHQPKVNDPALQMRLGFCMQLFDAANKNLEDSRAFRESQDYKNMENSLISAYISQNYCYFALFYAVGPPMEPILLKDSDLMGAVNRTSVAGLMAGILNHGGIIN